MCEGVCVGMVMCSVGMIMGVCGCMCWVMCEGGRLEVVEGEAIMKASSEALHCGVVWPWRVLPGRGGVPCPEWGGCWRGRPPRGPQRRSSLAEEAAATPGHGGATR